MAIPRTVLFPNALQLRPAPNGCDPHLSIALRDGLLLLDLYGNFLLIGHEVELCVCSEPTLRNIVAVEAKQAEDDDGYVLYLLDVRGFLTTAHIVLPFDDGSESSLAVKIVQSVFLLSNATHMAFHDSLNALFLSTHNSILRFCRKKTGGTDEISYRRVSTSKFSAPISSISLCLVCNQLVVGLENGDVFLLNVDVETEETIVPFPERPISLPFLFASKAGSITDFSLNIIDLGPATVCFQSRHPSSFSFTSSEQKSGIFGVVWNSGWLAIFRTSTSSSNAEQFHQPSLLFSVNTFTTLFSLRLSGLWLLATDYTGKTFLLNVKSYEAEFESQSIECNNGNFFFVFDSSRMLGPGAVKLFSTFITARITVPPPPEGLGEEPAEMGALNAIEGDSIVYVKFTGRIGVVSKFKTHLENLGPALK